jgi:hypothetical protein
MKIFCKVWGKPAVIVGYGPGRKGKTMAIVITEGMIVAVRLKDVELTELPDLLKAKDNKVVPITKKEA